MKITVKCVGRQLGFVKRGKMREVTERIDGNKEEKHRWRRDWVKGRERGVRKKKEGEIWWGGVEGGAVGRATQTN